MLFYCLYIQVISCFSPEIKIKMWIDLSTFRFFYLNKKEEDSWTRIPSISSSLGNRWILFLSKLSIEIDVQAKKKKKQNNQNNYIRKKKRRCGFSPRLMASVVPLHEVKVNSPPLHQITILGFSFSLCWYRDLQKWTDRSTKHHRQLIK